MWYKTEAHTHAHITIAAATCPTVTLPQSWHKHVSAECSDWHPCSTCTVGDAELAANYSV